MPIHIDTIGISWSAKNKNVLKRVDNSLKKGLALRNLLFHYVSLRFGGSFTGRASIAKEL